MPFSATPSSSPTITSPTHIPPLTRASTLPISRPAQFSPDRSLLAPEDAIYAVSPPRRPTQRSGNGATGNWSGNSTVNGGSGSDSRDRGRGKNKDRSGIGGIGKSGTDSVNGSRSRRGGRSRGRKRVIWKKLLWVKQSYPDNYTDQETFLEHLQRNPRLQPYDFWPLVADSTVIVQHVCSVIIFVVCFVVIFQERVSPVAIVGWGTLGTFLGWVLWDRWVAQEEAAQLIVEAPPPDIADEGSAASSTASSVKDENKLQGFTSLNIGQQSRHSHSASASSIHSQGSGSSPLIHSSSGPTFSNSNPLYGSKSSLSPRNQQRLATAKSAVLIYSALLGLSPILKSLTKSTSSDSIWALSAWLMIINVFFFDYGGGVGVKFPASLSTNAALMASTVLASRLPSTEHVFSLTLFSIEVFGLFPVFRRHLRHMSWRGHLALTAFLVMGAGGGVGVIVSGGRWKAAFVGITLGNILTCLAMGGCSWWLIGLQKYKNEIHGPWDPARPIIRRQWDNY